MEEPIYNNPEFEECSMCKGYGCAFCENRGYVEKEDLTDWDRADDIRDWHNDR